MSFSSHFVKIFVISYFFVFLGLSFNSSNSNNQSSISVSEAYKILNLDMDKKITKDDVNKAYIKIQKKIHPDISPETSRLSSIVNEAKDIVLNDIS